MNLDGLFFHTVDDDNFIHEQGMVIGHVRDGFYLCERFEWMYGTVSCRTIDNISAMTTWRFYLSSKEMQKAYKNSPKRPV